MAKSKEKNEAIKLRKRGKSIKDIAKKLKIAKSTISLWCRDIELTSQQLSELHKKMIKGGYIGRMKGARMQFERRIKKIKEYNSKGIEEIGKLSKRDILIAGIALYWGEGSKKRRCLSFCNSDPEMLKIFIKFLKEVLSVGKNRLKAWVCINEIHRNRLEEVEDYWSKIIGISRSQFIKTTFIKAKNKKRYNNFPTHYGTITIRVSASADIFYKINGLIEGLKSNVI